MPAVLEGPLAIPRDPDLMLMKSLDAQRAATTNLTAQAQAEAEEERQKGDRVQLIRAQIERRRAMQASDDAGLQASADLLDELSNLVRDRQVMLRSEGYQSYVFVNNDVYEGEWKANRMHGRGVLKRSSEPELYEGEWFLGQRNGVGTFHSGTFRTMYTGRWSDNKKVGKGELIEPEGAYIGEFHSPT